MTRRRSSTDRWAPSPIVVTKGLVAHVPIHRDDECELGYGPRDGDPVGVPAPCARLVAGYWCACGSGFASFETDEPVSRARVEAVPDGDWRGHIQCNGDVVEPGVRWPTETDRRALQLQVEALPVGTVVERFGTGIALRFGDAVRSEPWAVVADYPF